MSFWDDHPNAFTDAKRLWLEGKSAKQIASEIGAASRNMVLGKLHRMGLSNRDGGNQNGRNPKQTTVLAYKARTKKPRLVRAPIPIPHADDRARVMLMELRNEHCRFPVAHGYCGLLEADLSNGIPYCPGHMARTHNPIERKRVPLRQSSLTGGFA